MVESTQPVNPTAVVGGNLPRPFAGHPHTVISEQRPHDALVLSEHARQDLIARTFRVQSVVGAELALALRESELRRWGKLAFHDELEECDEVSAPAIANTILEGIVGYLWTTWSAAAASEHDPGDTLVDDFVGAVEGGLARGLDAAVDTLSDFGIEGDDVAAIRSDVERRVVADLHASLGALALAD